MINIQLSNEILRRITAIDRNRFSLSTIKLSPSVYNKLRKNSKRKSTYASNKIEGNPLTEDQVEKTLEKDSHQRFLKPEQDHLKNTLLMTPVNIIDLCKWICLRSITPDVIILPIRKYGSIIFFT